MNKTHTLSVIVENKPGVLARISGLFARRGYNIESLAVGPTERPEISRITIQVAVDSPAVLEQITKQLNKLIPVLKVVRLDEETTIARAIMLVKVSADSNNRPQIVDAANIFRARVVDVAQESVVIEATGTPGKLRALLEVLEPFGIRELIQSGQIALNRGPKTMAPSK